MSPMLLLSQPTLVYASVAFGERPHALYGLALPAIPKLTMCFETAIAAAKALRVVIVICGTIIHSSIHADPDRSCS